MRRTTVLAPVLAALWLVNAPQGCNLNQPEPVQTCVTLRASQPAAGSVREVVDCDEQPPAQYPLRQEG